VNIELAQCILKHGDTVLVKKSGNNYKQDISYFNTVISNANKPVTKRTVKQFLLHRKFGSFSNAPDLILGGVGFESQPEHWLL
jgi:hypothetical protein